MQRILISLLILVFTFCLFYTNCESISATATTDIVDNIVVHSTKGKHAIADLYDIPFEKFVFMSKEWKEFDKIVQRILTTNGMTVLGVNYHKFEGFGLTAVWLLSESHMSIHTWPEYGYLALDVYTCGKTNPENIAKEMQEFLMSGKQNKQLINRGDKDGILQAYPRFNQDICLNGDNDEEADWTIFRNCTVFEKHSSKFQKMEVIECPTIGKCLVLDNQIQFCTSDNDRYTSELVERPLHFLKASQKKDLNVTIVGGGDGWVASYMLEKHPEVKNIELVDLDEDVTKITLKHFSNYFQPEFMFNNHPKVKMHFEDAAEFLRGNQRISEGSVDFIIIDCTDHTRDASKVLYTPEFYTNIYKKLKVGGVFVQQMNTMDESYEPFLKETQTSWEKIGFNDVTRWHTDLKSFSGTSVYYMAYKF